MATGNGKLRLGYFLAGLGIGATVALLFAPHSGARTRRLLAEKTGRSREYLSARGRQLGRQAEEAIEKGRGWVVKGIDRVPNLREIGKRVYRGKFDA